MAPFGPAIPTRAERQRKKDERLEAYLEGIRNERLRVMNASKGVTWCEASWCRRPTFYQTLQLVYFYEAKGDPSYIVEDPGEVSPRHVLLACPRCKKEIQARPDWVMPDTFKLSSTR